MKHHEKNETFSRTTLETETAEIESDQNRKRKIGYLNLILCLILYSKLMILLSNLISRHTLMPCYIPPPKPDIGLKE